MIIAIISDVHSNFVALEAVLEDMGEVDCIISAGDAVGYYPFPDMVLDAFRFHGIRNVIGNQDYHIVLKMAGKTPMFDALVPASAENQDYLKDAPMKLRFEVDGHRYSIFHAAPKSLSRRIFEDEVEESLLNEAESDVLILGHTHMPFIKRFDQGLVVNPGSVGAPRDGDARACYALLDTETMLVDIHRVWFDEKRLEDACISLQIQPRHGTLKLTWEH